MFNLFRNSYTPEFDKVLNDPSQEETLYEGLTDRLSFQATLSWNHADDKIDKFYLELYGMYVFRVDAEFVPAYVLEAANREEKGIKHGPQPDLRTALYIFIRTGLVTMETEGFTLIRVGEGEYETLVKELGLSKNDQ